MSNKNPFAPITSPKPIHDTSDILFSILLPYGLVVFLMVLLVSLGSIYTSNTKTNKRNLVKFCKEIEFKTDQCRRLRL